VVACSTAAHCTTRMCATRSLVAEAPSGLETSRVLTDTVQLDRHGIYVQLLEQAFNLLAEPADGHSCNIITALPC
jgi:hypothetical protein